MAITKIKIDSKDMKGVLKFVKLMTKSMTFDANMENANWKKQRKRNDFFYKLMPKEKGIKYKNIKLGNRGVMKVYNSEDYVREDIVIIYLHGGGFVTGNAFVCKSYCSMLAKYANCRVYAVEYALAPENKFPKGFEDCCKAYEEIVSLHPDSKVVLVGESAGGNYSLALGLKYKNDEKIACVIANSPTVDFSGAIDHTKNENKDFIVKVGVSEPLSRMYVGSEDATNPYISPYYGDFADFPPTFITCDINETLYADSKALYEKCEAAGVKVELIEVEGAYHAFAVSGTNTPETKQILEDTVKFIDSNL